MIILARISALAVSLYGLGRRMSGRWPSTSAPTAPKHPNVAIGINNLGLVLRDQGNLAGARAAFERALAIAKRFYDFKHPKVRIYTSNLATLPPAPSQ